MKPRFPIVIGLILFAYAFSIVELEPQAGGEVRGIVQLPQVATQSEPAIGRYRRGGSASQRTETAQSVLIWIEAEDTTPSAPDEPVMLDQSGLQFNPRILAVRQNQQVRILNSDPVYHNVFSLSSVKRFDVGRRPMGEYLDVLFEKQGIVDVFCDIHSNMHSVIYVVSPQTYSWETCVAGDPFSLPSLPDGRYKLNIYAPGFELYSRDITIENGNTINLGTITLKS